MADHMPAEARNNIMHSTLTLSEKARLMASDVFKPEDAVTIGDDVAISVNFPSEKDIDAAYAKLTVGGTVMVPLANQFWGGRFGQFKDKFGVLWMFHFQATDDGEKDFSIKPYLRFDKSCDEVMRHIRSIIGGNIDSMVSSIIFSDIPRYMLTTQ